MKRLLPFLFFVLTAATALAQRPARMPLTGIQPSGEFVTVYKEGNSKLAFYSTEDGYAVIHETDGAWYYAVAAADGIVSGSVLAHNPAERSAEEAAFVQEKVLTKEQAYATPAARRSPLKASAITTNGLGIYGRSANGTVKSIGATTIPVIMVEFADRKFQETSTIEKMMRYLNEAGYNDEANTVGSVRDYFLAQSNNMFNPTFNVVAKVTAAGNYAVYGANSSTKRDPNVNNLIKEAIDSAVVQGVDFTPMLVNGKIPLVVVIFAGPGEHNSYETGQEDYLWAMFSTFSYKSDLGGPQFSSFFIGDEIFQSYSVSQQGGQYVYTVTGNRFEGMGVLCHEFGHALGLPDFYNSNTGAGVTDYWSVMDYGQYWLNGYRPIGYSAYERNFMGWLQINDLGSTPETLTIYPLGSSDNTDKQAYRIVNPANEREYYILENRQPSTWYPSQLGSGLLIYHVNYLASAWSGNTPNNNASSPRYQVLPADGTNQVYSTLRNNGLTAAQAYAQFAGDLFPGTTGTTTINSFTPYSGSAITTPIYNIAEWSEDGTVTLQYLDLPQPAGKFVRIKSNATGGYVGATRTAQPIVTDAADAGIYYVTEDNRLTSVQQGLFLSSEDGFPCMDYAAAGTTFGFGVSTLTAGATAGTYSIQNETAGNYLKASADGLTVSADGNDAACEFVLEEVTEIPLSINTIAGYATLNLPVAFSVPSDVQVLYASRLHDGLLTITEAGITTVAANTPVMLYKEGGGDITVTLATEGQTISGNLLTATNLGGTLVPAEDKAYVYALNTEGTKGSFRLLNDTDRGISGFKAYFVAETGGAAPQYLYFAGDDVTGISENTLLPIGASTPAYDLQGRYVGTAGSLPAGIYILKQGKTSRKVIIR